jgi:hypothetical protein
MADDSNLNHATAHRLALARSTSRLFFLQRDATL